ncbi:hypothetical protein [Nonomuraea dietziae]|uniref:hypothetical protein n=1 Tax=Nonomuraea dietziae TaxID=65515 RepID=UPI0031D74043
MSRNPRHQIYPAVGDLPAAERSGSLVRLWRMRTELLLTAGLALVLLAAVGGGRWVPFLALTSAVSVPAVTRVGRNWIVAHAWCVASRHRLQRLCLETTMHTRAGRIPLILWITPTAPWGEGAGSHQSGHLRGGLRGLRRGDRGGLLRAGRQDPQAPQMGPPGDRRNHPQGPERGRGRAGRRTAVRQERLGLAEVHPRRDRGATRQSARAAHPGLTSFRPRTGDAPRRTGVP